MLNDESGHGNHESEAAMMNRHGNHILVYNDESEYLHEFYSSGNEQPVPSIYQQTPSGNVFPTTDPSVIVV